MSTDLLLPPNSELDAEFWEGARAGELRVQRCPESGRYIFPPRSHSPWSAGARPEWVSVSGRGTIWSFVIPHPPLVPQFAELAPYNVILVALDEDPAVRLVGNLVAREGGAINEVDSASIEIGAAVRVVFDAVTDEVSLPRWVLA